MELKQIRQTMVAMDERLDQMLVHLDGSALRSARFC